MARKSALLTYLETKGAMTTPDEIDVQIIDGAFFLHLHKDLPTNFDRVANFIKGRKGDSLCS